MKKKLAALRQSRGKQIEIMEANVSCSNEQQTKAYNDAKTELKRLDAEIAECERLIAEDAEGEGQPDAAKLAAENAELNRKLKITELANKHNLAKLGAEHIAKGSTFDQFQAAALDAIAARETETRSQVQMTRDEGDTRRVAFSEALRHRAGLITLANNQPGYDYRGLASQGLVALAAECVRAKGQNPSRMSPSQIAELAMSTTDFPLILAGTADASLRAGYALAPNNWRQLFARRSAPNFKNQTELHVGMNNAPFGQVPESGEFKHGSLTEGSIAWKLLTYGQIIGFTRQLIVNDNFGALTNIPSQMGLKAAIKQAALAWATFVAANTATYPGDAGATALFAAGHSNLINPGTAISVDSLGVALQTIRAQTDLGGDKMAFGDNFFLVVPTGKEQLARQYTSPQFMPTAQTGVNPWSNSFTVVASAELQSNSATAWYVMPNPIGIAEVFIVGYLDGNEGVYSETRQGFDIDGTEWKARMDVGFGAVDYRGAYKNLGA
jgi:hypothetical protein